jgi:hypothetical protein
MEARTNRGWLFVPLGVLLVAMLACGGFQVRVTPTPRPTPETVQAPTVAAAARVAPTAVPTKAPTATRAPDPTATQAPAGMAAGGKARVMAGGGLNVRDSARAKGKQIGRLDLNAVVTLLEGPVQADSYSWWKIQSGAGLTGWVAAGPANDPWLVPATAASVTAQPAGGPKLVDRPIKLGDRVQVTTAPGQPLTVREYAGKTETAVARVLAGTLFTVRSGPVKQDGLVWWELEGDAVKGWAAEGDGTDRWLTPVE